MSSGNVPAANRRCPADSGGVGWPYASRQDPVRYPLYQQRGGGGGGVPSYRPSHPLHV